MRPAMLLRSAALCRASMFTGKQFVKHQFGAQSSCVFVPAARATQTIARRWCATAQSVPENPVSAEPLDLTAQGDESYVKNDFIGALKLYTESCEDKKGENLQFVLLRRAQANLRLSKFEDVEADLRRVIEINPKNAHAVAAHRSLAFTKLEILQMRSDAPTEDLTNQAIESFGHAIDISDKDIDSLYGRGCALLMTSKFGESILDFNRVLDINDAFVPALIGKAEAALNLNRFRDAIECYAHALKKAEEFYNVDGAPSKIQLGQVLSDILYKRGKAYFHSKDYDTAILDFTDVIKMDLLHVAASHLHRAECYRFKGNFNACISDCDEFMVTNNVSPQAFLTRAAANEALGNLEEAKEDRETAASLTQQHKSHETKS